MTTIKFKRAALAMFSVITKPGKYELEAYSNVTEKNLVTDADGSRPRYIASFKAIAADKLTQVKETFKDAEEVDIDQTSGLFLTANIWVGSTQPALPMKGEKVECNIDFVTSRDGSPVLRITNIKLKPAEKAVSLDLESFFAEAEVKQTSDTLTHA